MLMGIANYGETLLLGEFGFLKEVSHSDLILKARTMFSQKLAMVIPPEESAANAILEAMTMGEKGNLPQSLKLSYRLSGAMHLLALSGLHVGFIYGGLSWIFGWIPKIGPSQIFRGIATILFLVFYAIFSGATPSICRAVLMASIYEIGKMAEREKHGLNALSISALTICLIDPSSPSSISFQLSYSAMLGILLIQPHLEGIPIWPNHNHILRKVWQTATLSVSCQLATAPLTLLYFGSFPLISLLTNLLTMPVVSVIMTIAPIAVITSDMDIAGTITGTILHYSIDLLNLLTEILSRVI